MLHETKDSQTLNLPKDNLKSFIVTITIKERTCILCAIVIQVLEVEMHLESPTPK